MPPASAVNRRPRPLDEREERLHGRVRLGRGQVDRERHELAAEREHHLLGDGLARLVLGLDGRRAEVRRDHDVRQPEQRRLGGRLGREHVDRGTGDLTLLDRRGQHGFLDDPAAGRVDEAQTGLRLRQQSSASIRPIVSLVLGRWIVRKSAVPNSSSSVGTSSTPS